MNTEKMTEFFRDLSDKIMKYALTPEQASAIIAYLHKAFPYESEAGQIRSRVLIETGVGESLMMVAQLSEGRKAPEQFAIDFVGHP